METKSLEEKLDVLLAEIKSLIANLKLTENTEGSLVIQEIPAKKLVWGKVADRKMDWNEAVRWCKDQGGRLPTQIELLQAYEDKVEGFGQEVYYWSATTVSVYATSAWYVSMSVGSTYGYYKTNASNVRCIRELD